MATNGSLHEEIQKIVLISLQTSIAQRHKYAGCWRIDSLNENSTSLPYFLYQCGFKIFDQIIGHQLLFEKGNVAVKCQDT